MLLALGPDKICTIQSDPWEHTKITITTVRMKTAMRIV